MKLIWIYSAVLFRNIFRIETIQTRIHRPIKFIDNRASSTRHFRHIDSSAPYGANFDWEHGLREATVQALLREHFGDENLRKHIYSAPLLGKQDKATPFGDIAILGRGQLYANYAGFIFVQDPYQNDCDNCHNIDEADTARGRCITHHCQIWRPKSNEKLMALWTIKRIRHRSRQDGNKYEVEYAISPVGLRHQNGGYLTKEGTFNYNLPGHVFVLKSADIPQHLENDQISDHPKHGAFIAQTPDGRKYILHSFHGLLTPETPRYYDLPPKYPPFTSTASTIQYSEEDEKKVYQSLLEVLHKKTSPESNRPTSETSTTLSDKTLVQFPDGQIVSITELETPFVTRTTPGYVAVHFPDTNGIKATPSTEVTEGQSFEVTLRKVTPQSYGVMMPQTTPLTYRTTASATTQGFLIHTTAAEPPTTPNEILQTPGAAHTEPMTLYTAQDKRRPQLFGTTPSTSTGTTKPPSKTTFHFFAAEEAEKTTANAFPSSTTAQQKVYTEYEYVLPDTLVSTKPTVDLVSKTERKPQKETTKYPTMSSTKQTLITKTASNNYRPATVVKVTKPTEPATKSYSSVLTTSETLKTSSSTEPIIKITPPTVLEPSTSYYITSKEPHTFKVPTTVLEESTVGSTSEQKNYYPSTQFEQVLTITQEPKTTHEKYEVPKGTTLQFYNPTTVRMNLTSIEQDTMLLQEPIIDIETKEPTRETMLESTTYNTKVPTLEPDKGLIETTLGVTKIMGTSQNKTTEMVYYATEETDGSVKETTRNLASIGTTGIFETKATSPSTPKRIVTTIRADGTVSVKTSSISADEELFGVTKSFIKKYKATRRPQINTTSGPSDFLVNEGPPSKYKVSLFKKPLKDYSEDDIFGLRKSTTTRASNKIGSVKHYTKSDLEQALFDTDKRKSKALRDRKSSAGPNVVFSTLERDATTSANIVTGETGGISRRMLPQVVGNHFYVATTQTAGVVTTESVPVATAMLDDESIKPVTSQSYLTSISYEVNKRKRLLDAKSNEKSRNVNATEDEIKEKRHSTEPSYTASLENDFALRLVGHARGVEYLERVGTTGASTLATTLVSTSTKTTKKSKYTRRRSYAAKAKRPTRKKIVKSEKT